MNRFGNSKGPEPLLWSPSPLPLVVSGGGRTSSVPSSFREFIYYKPFQNRLFADPLFGRPGRDSFLLRLARSKAIIAMTMT
jgi:hypothetical protein